jgi:predicted transcriptional regulator
MTMKSASGAATEAELAVLKSLWKDGAGTVRTLHKRLRREGRDWAYTTRQTLLGRLAGKGLVTVDRRRFAHEYAAAVTREEFLNRRLTDLADQLCDGTRLPLVMALVDGSRFSAEDIARFRRLHDELDKPGTAGRPPAAARRGRRGR